MSSNRRIGLGFLIAIFVIFVLPNLVFYLWPRLFSPFDDKPFDAAKWKAAQNAYFNKNPRGPMAEDLRARFLKVGMSKDQVRVLLGPPGNSQVEEEKGVTDTYTLGYWGGMAIDGHLLVIYYDADGKVTKTEIVPG